METTMVKGTFEYPPSHYKDLLYHISMELHLHWIEEAPPTRYSAYHVFFNELFHLFETATIERVKASKNIQF